MQRVSGRCWESWPIRGVRRSAGKDPLLPVVWGPVGGSDLASLLRARRFRMRRTCFLFSSRMRCTSARARRGCWAFRSQWSIPSCWRITFMWEESVVDVAAALIDAVRARCPEFHACSVDEGCYRKKNRNALDAWLAVNALPKKGTRTLADQAHEGVPAFREARQQHVAVKSCLATFGLRGLVLRRPVHSAHENPSYLFLGAMIGPCESACRVPVQPRVPALRTISFFTDWSICTFTFWAYVVA